MGAMSRTLAVSLLCLLLWKPRVCAITRSELYEEILRQTSAWDDEVISKRHGRPTGGGINLYSSYTPYQSSNEGPEPSGRCPAAAILEEDRRLACGPHRTIVPLPPGPTDVIRVPELAEVDRCQGSCYQRGLFCSPVVTREATVPVLHVNMTAGRSVVQCAEVTVTVHDRCRCSCAVRPVHCNAKQYRSFHPNQRYSYGDCSCKCKDMSEAMECMAQGRDWDPSNCTCGCQQMLSCSTGFYFDSSSCRCQSVPEERS